MLPSKSNLLFWVSDISIFLDLPSVKGSVGGASEPTGSVVAPVFSVPGSGESVYEDWTEDVAFCVGSPPVASSSVATIITEIIAASIIGAAARIYNLYSQNRLKTP